MTMLDRGQCREGIQPTKTTKEQRKDPMYSTLEGILHSFTKVQNSEELINSSPPEAYVR